jgi:type II secretion system protein G
MFKLIVKLPKNEMHRENGLTLVEILVVCVIIGILGAIFVPRFIGSQDRAKIGAAFADLDHFRQAIGLYDVDYQDYPSSNYDNVAALTAVLVDPQGKAYMTLPDGSNFASFSYEYDNSITPTTYRMTITAFDQKNTTLICTPQGISTP